MGETQMLGVFPLLEETAATLLRSLAYLQDKSITTKGQPYRSHPKKDPVVLFRGASKPNCNPCCSGIHHLSPKGSWNKGH